MLPRSQCADKFPKQRRGHIVRDLARCPPRVSNGIGTRLLIPAPDDCPACCGGGPCAGFASQPEDSPAYNANDKRLESGLDWPRERGRLRLVWEKGVSGVSRWTAESPLPCALGQLIRIKNQPSFWKVGFGDASVTPTCQERTCRYAGEYATEHRLPNKARCDTAMLRVERRKSY